MGLNRRSASGLSGGSKSSVPPARNTFRCALAFQGSPVGTLKWHVTVLPRPSGSAMNVTANF